MRKNKDGNWTKINILKSQAEEIRKILKEGEFANVSQFVVFVVRKELEFRKKIQSSVVDEKEIKEKLESWIEEINKKTKLDERLKKSI